MLHCLVYLFLSSTNQIRGSVINLIGQKHSTNYCRQYNTVSHVLFLKQGNPLIIGNSFRLQANELNVLFSFAFYSQLNSNISLNVVAWKQCSFNSLLNLLFNYSNFPPLEKLTNGRVNKW